ncbi:hypothetical protein [Nocardia sp. IFM 10818]
MHRNEFGDQFGDMRPAQPDGRPQLDPAAEFVVLFGYGVGEHEAAAAMLSAVEAVLAQGHAALTPDMGGVGTTESLGKAICARLEQPAS